MKDQMPDLPGKLAAICADFALCEGKEKLELLLQYADSLPAIPARLESENGQAEAVPECMTPVRIHADKEDGGMRFFFDIPATAPTVRGFASLLSAGLAGLSPQEILEVPEDFYRCTGLERALSLQRMRGFSAMLAHMRRLAMASLEEESGADPG
jgi:cysteine desulfuration protein SufE